MANKTADFKGLKCPQPVLKIVAMAPQMQPGDTLEVVADCSTFAQDVKAMCERMKKTLLYCNNEGNLIRAKIQF